jgi:hypothetical protein
VYLSALLVDRVAFRSVSLPDHPNGEFQRLVVYEGSLPALSSQSFLLASPCPLHVVPQCSSASVVKVQAELHEHVLCTVLHSSEVLCALLSRFEAGLQVNLVSVFQQELVCPNIRHTKSHDSAWKHV